MLSGTEKFSMYMKKGVRLNDYQIFLSSPVLGECSGRSFKEVFNDFNDEVFGKLLREEIKEIDIPDSIPVWFYKKFISDQPIAIAQKFKNMLSEGSDWEPLEVDEEKCKRFFYAMCLSKVSVVFKILYAVNLEYEREALVEKSKSEKKDKSEFSEIEQTAESEAKDLKTTTEEVRNLLDGVSDEEENEDGEEDLESKVRSILFEESSELSPEMKAIQVLVESKSMPEGFTRKLYDIVGPELQQQMVSEEMIQPFSVTVGHLVSYYKKVAPCPKTVETQLAEIRPTSYQMRKVLSDRVKYGKLKEDDARKVYPAATGKMKKKLEDYFSYLQREKNLKFVTDCEDIIKTHKIYPVSKIQLECLKSIDHALDSGIVPEDYTSVLLERGRDIRHRSSSSTRGKAQERADFVERGRSHSRAKKREERGPSEIDDKTLHAYDSNVQIQDRWFKGISDDLYKLTMQRVQVATLKSKWRLFKKRKTGFKPFLDKLISNATLVYNDYYERKLNFNEMSVTSLVEEKKYSFFQLLDAVKEVFSEESSTPWLDSFYYVFFVKMLRKVPITIITMDDYD
jgi:hypothetical protein